jgi:hypothetical protein
LLMATCKKILHDIQMYEKCLKFSSLRRLAMGIR